MPDQVETRIGTPFGGVIRLRWRCMSRGGGLAMIAIGLC